jgi:hypothetical protein
MKYWEIIGDNLSKAGLSWGCVTAIDSNGRTIWIADAHRGDGQRFIVRADEKLTAFVELQRAIHAFAVDLIRKNFTILAAESRIPSPSDVLHHSCVAGVGDATAGVDWTGVAVGCE